MVQILQIIITVPLKQNYLCKCSETNKIIVDIKFIVILSIFKIKINA